MALPVADLSGITSGPGPAEPKPPAGPANAGGGTSHLDVVGFGEALHAALKNSVAGYCMQLRQNGSTVYTLNWNWARRPGEGSLGWNPDRPAHVASLSKLLTGIGLAKLLDEKGISLDTKIIGYLPDYWTKGIFVNQVTFRHLMTHTSGFVTGGSASDYLTMKNRVQLGSSGVGTNSYENMNYGLCVVLFAVITGAVSKGFVAGALSDQIWAIQSLNAYNQYMQQKVFGPAGVFGATFEHNSDCALAYTFPVFGAGWDSGSVAAHAGGTGWHLSVRQMLDVMDAFRRRGTILPAAKALAAMNAGCGIDKIISTPAGVLYDKNGAWGSASYAEQSVAFFLPENMELVVFANSNLGVPPLPFRGTIRNLYRRIWAPRPADAVLLYRLDG